MTHPVETPRRCASLAAVLLVAALAAPVLVAQQGAVRGAAGYVHHLGPPAAPDERLGGDAVGKPDWADRPEPTRREWLTRPKRRARHRYKYNDVRVNALALAALNVWRRGRCRRCSARR
jgi:hypothetical protein